MPLRSMDKLDKSRRQEKVLSRRFQGKLQVGSGNKSFHKGDVKTKVYLMEAKRTDKDSMILKGEWLRKIRSEAFRYGKIPTLAIEIGDERYIIIEENDFKTATT